MCALHFVKENLQDIQRRPTVNETIKKDGYRKFDHKGTLSGLLTSLLPIGNFRDFWSSKSGLLLPKTFTTGALHAR